MLPFHSRLLLASLHPFPMWRFSTDGNISYLLSNSLLSLSPLSLVPTVHIYLHILSYFPSFLSLRTYISPRYQTFPCCSQSQSFHLIGGKSPLFLLSPSFPALLFPSDRPFQTPSFLDPITLLRLGSPISSPPNCTTTTLSSSTFH